MKLDLFGWFRKKIVKMIIKSVIKDMKNGDLKEKAHKLLNDKKGVIIEKVDEKAKKAVEKFNKQITELLEKAVKELEN